ncbi:hypothetical protein CspHIS471_0700030 [Cutaneotrichosporon sp. HIS471]|nr:hypothetical protein CspHIS471_0700030 [Cutaneotrichosporon sp. HIS471]
MLRDNPLAQRKACTSCRALKTRCLPSTTPQAPCLRCTGLGYECVYRELKRGPPKGRKQAVKGNVKANSATPVPSTGPQGGSPPRSGHLAQYEPDRLPSHLFAQAVSAAYSPVASTSTSRPPTQPPFASFFPNELAVAPHRLTLESFFEPDATPDSASPTGPPWLVYTDPVTVGLISEPEARLLFSQFMDRVAPHGHIFDSHFHTYERVRSSPPLFAAIISAASRFLHPSLAEITLDLAETNIARALRRDDVDIELVQAIMVLVLWKRPADRSAYYKLGLVARLLAQLRVRWDTDQTFSSLEEERAHVNVERTMSIASTTELSYSILLRLPSHGIPVADHNEMLAWAQRHAHLDVPGDMFKACLAELWQFHFSASGDLWFRSAAEWEERQTAWRAVVDRWRDGGLIPPEYRGNAGLLADGGIMSRAFLGLKLGFVEPAAMLDAAEAFAATFKAAAFRGELQFFPEYPLSALVLPGVLVFQARNLLSPEELVRARGIMKELRGILDGLPESVTRDHALGGVQRSYRRLQGAITNWGSSELVQDPMQDLDVFLTQIGFMFGEEALGMLFRPEESSLAPTAR